MMRTDNGLPTICPHKFDPAQTLIYSTNVGDGRNRVSQETIHQKAIIIGASSGIGNALARQLSAAGYHLGLTGRRGNLLDELARNLPQPAVVRDFDIAKTESAIEEFKKLIDDMGGVDLIIINAGVGKTNPDLLWDDEKLVIDINVRGFTAMVNVAFNYFKKQGRGHIVGISSILALKGTGRAPAYSASKAFVSSYMDALRRRKARLNLPITVTDIKPGFIDTPMVKDNEYLFWVSPVEKAAQQIHSAIRRKKSRIVITRRWNIVAFLIHLLPDFIFYRF